MGCDGQYFGLEDLLPGKLAVAPPPPSTTEQTKRMQNTYRPTQERQFLEFRLNEWVKGVYLADPYRCVRPVDLILSRAQKAILIRADPRKINCAQDITTLLDETTEWDAEWSAKVYGVITKFESEYACISEQTVTQKKRKRK